MSSQVQEQQKQSEKPTLLGIITAPTLHFQRLKEQPLYHTPLLVFSLIFTALVALKSSLILQDAHLAHTLLPQTDQQPPLLATIILALLTIPLVSLLGAGISWGILKLFPSKATFPQLFSLQVHLSLLFVAATLLETLSFLLTHQVSEVPVLSLASFIPASGVSQTILSAIELFNLWTIALYGVALQVIAELSPKQAWLASGLFFLLGILLSIILSFLPI